MNGCVRTQLWPCGICPVRHEPLLEAAPPPTMGFHTPRPMFSTFCSSRCSASGQVHTLVNICEVMYAPRVRTNSSQQESVQPLGFHADEWTHSCRATIAGHDAKAHHEHVVYDA